MKGLRKNVPTRSRQMLAIVAAAVLIVAAAAFFYLNQAGTPGLPGVVTPPTASGELMVAGPLGDMTLGDPKAPNVVIEYASMTCSHCRRFNEEVFPEFKKRYIDT